MISPWDTVLMNVEQGQSHRDLVAYCSDVLGPEGDRWSWTFNKPIVCLSRRSDLTLIQLRFNVGVHTDCSSAAGSRHYGDSSGARYDRRRPPESSA